MSQNDRNRFQFEEEELDLLNLIQYIIRYWYLLILGILIGANLIAILVYRKADTYTSYASIFIQSDTNSSTTLSDVQLSNALSDDFIELANSKAVTDTAVAVVNESLHTNLTRKELIAMSAITNTKDTRLLVFEVTSTNAQIACEAAEALATATAERVSSIMNFDEPTFVDHAEVSEPNNKGLVKKAALGGIMGLVIVILILFISFLINDKIVSESDVEKYLESNVLGCISLDMSANYKKNKKEFQVIDKVKKFVISKR